ncbi:MAG: lysophospholipid acyltransferase family protein [Verrucomicrobiales bacterium]
MSPVYRFGYTLFRLAGIAFFDHRVIHKERLVQDEPMLVASNHVSFVDPPMVGVCYDDNIYYLARKSLFVGPAKWFYEQWNSIPVDQENPDFSGLKNIIKLIKAGERVLIFPEGNRSPDGSLQRGEAGVGMVVAKAKCRVQPVRIFGAHEALPRGTCIPRPSRLRIVVGHPIEFSEEQLANKGRDAYQAISDRIMDEIASLKLPDGI